MASTSESKLWVVLDQQGRLIQHSFNAKDVEFMQRYVDQARSVGDRWRLVEYNLGRDLSAAESSV